MYKIKRMKLLEIDQFVSVIKLVTYSMLVGMSFLFMGMQLGLGPFLLLGSLGLIIAHIIHQCLFNRNFSQRLRIPLFMIAFASFFMVLAACRLHLVPTIALCTGFVLSFTIDMFSECRRNNKRNKLPDTGLKTVLEKFITNGY